MGSRIFYKVANVTEADRAWEVLQTIEENQQLIAIGKGIDIINSNNLIRAKSKSISMVEYFTRNMGEGEFCVSGCVIEKGLNINFEKMLELVTVIFEKLNQKVKMRYLYGSCAFNGEYFSISQIDRITTDGALFESIDLFKCKIKEQ
jgi:hypothetical protein